MAQYRRLRALSHGRTDDGHDIVKSAIDVSIGSQIIYDTGPSVLLTVENSYGLIEIQVPVELARIMADDFILCANSVDRSMSLPLKPPKESQSVDN
jgi:hypothetical protein